MPVQKGTAILGVAKQTAKGSIAANPTFAHGVSGGGILSVEVKQDEAEVTSGKRFAANVVREAVACGSDFKAPAYMKSLGLWLLGALGSVTTTGAQAPYTHTYATGDLPYLTVFEKGMDTTYEAVKDNKIDELTIAWDAAKPIELSVKGLGTAFSYPATFSAGTDESGSESFLVPIGGTFQYDLDGSTLATAAVVKGEITVKNNPEAINISSAIEAGDVFEGKQQHTLKLTIVPDSLADFRTVVTGAANGAASTGVVTYGSVSLGFKENGGSGTLAVTGSKVAFECVWPDTDAKGGHVEVELVGKAVGTTTPLVYVLTNGQASY